LKIIQLIFIGLLLITPLQAQAEKGGYLIWKQQVVHEFDTSSDLFAYHTFSPEVRNLMNKRIKEADGFISGQAQDPVLWYIYGWLGRFEQGFYYDDLQAAGKFYNRYSPENQALIKKYQSYYRKALDLNEKNDAPAHLTAEMLTTMGTDVLAAPDIKQRALERNMQLAREGNVQTENENYEWELSQFVLANYAEQKDYENYLKTVNEMIERFPNSSRMHELLEYKRQAESAIEKRDREAADIEGQKR